MLSKNQIKRIQSLRLKKFREIQNQFLIEGSKLVVDVLESRYRVSDIFATGEWIRKQIPAGISAEIPLTEVTENEMARITALSSPSPVLAIVTIPVSSPVPAPTNEALTLVLDDIRDPGNLGTIIRIADWFGISHIVCSENSVELYNPKVIQSTMGSFARVNVQNVKLPEFFSGIDPSVRVYGTFPEGNSIYSAELLTGGIIVIGSESTGISEKTASFVTDKISIPSYDEGKGRKEHAESLNASVATAIVCSEFRRRKV